MNLLPLGLRVIVQRKEKEAVTKGGIIIPEYSIEKDLQAKVIKLGTGIDVDDCILREGDSVLIGKFTGTEMKVEGQPYVMVHLEEIMAKILEPEADEKA